MERVEDRITTAGPAVATETCATPGCGREADSRWGICTTCFLQALNWVPGEVVADASPALEVEVTMMGAREEPCQAHECERLGRAGGGLTVSGDAHPDDWPRWAVYAGVLVAIGAVGRLVWGLGRIVGWW